jgi:hypothetical protein
MIVDLSTRQLGVIHYALSSTHISFFADYNENGTAGLDMSDKEARRMIHDLNEASSLFQKLYNEAWARDQEAKEKQSNVIKPKTA